VACAYIYIYLRIIYNYGYNLLQLEYKRVYRMKVNIFTKKYEDHLQIEKIRTKILTVILLFK